MPDIDQPGEAFCKIGEIGPAMADPRRCQGLERSCRQPAFGKGLAEPGIRDAGRRNPRPDGDDPDAILPRGQLQALFHFEADPALTGGRIAGCRLADDGRSCGGIDIDIGGKEQGGVGQGGCGDGVVQHGQPSSRQRA